MQLIFTVMSLSIVCFERCNFGGFSRRPPCQHGNGEPHVPTYGGCLIGALKHHKHSGLLHVLGGRSFLVGRDVGDQPLLVSDDLCVSRASPNVDQQTIDLQHPNQRVVVDTAGDGEVGIERH